MLFFQFFLIVSFSILNEFDTSSSSAIVSVFISLAVVLFLCVFLIVGVWKWISCVKKKNFDSKSTLSEFFRGLKKTKMGTTYNLISMVRKAILLGFIIFGQSIALYPYLIGICVFQGIYAIVIVILRPFENIKDNFVEITNEAVFSMLIFLTLFFNKEDDWTDTMSSVYLYLMLFPVLFIFLITFSKFKIIKFN